MNRGAQRTTQALEHASHIVLKNVPRTATSGDVRRTVAMAGLKGVKDVALMYKHYKPTGKAVLTMTLPDYTKDALREAKQMVIGSNPIEAFPTEDKIYFTHRTRGVVGRAQAMWRGKTQGDGPAAGGFLVGRTVTLCGTPWHTNLEAIDSLTEDFELTDARENSIFSTPPPEQFSRFSRFVIIFRSPSEAERFVRKFHRTSFKGSTLHAGVIY